MATVNVSICHFYYEGVVWNSFILLVALLSFVGGVPAFWWLQEGLSFISNYPLDPPTADHVSVLLALILLEFQVSVTFRLCSLQLTMCLSFYPWSSWSSRSDHVSVLLALILLEFQVQLEFQVSVTFSLSDHVLVLLALILLEFQVSVTFSLCKFLQLTKCPHPTVPDPAGVPADHVSVLLSLILLEFQVSVLYVMSPTADHVSVLLALILLEFQVSVTFTLSDHVSVLLALILLEFQMIRRLWECLYVSIFSDVSVHLVHYLLGMIYYLAVPISIIAEGPKLDGTRLSLSDVRWSHVIGTGLFIWSFWQQNKAHIILANLRKDKRGYVVTRGHKIPYGGWFEYVSNPHYLAELLMYLSIIIVLGGEHYLSWVIQGYILVELGLCGWITHNWYRTKFDNYPSSRSILIPYIF
ncbi:SRD5A3 [Branchiostoma lanceolatum]|uniref:Polyprenal reductase n=1 Tax=Branchiostoma lanceolatum TaxID=7740 RepID=A0A8K0A2A6_BRALA|nr:SRD5A3 [Branchiostoma lanceolatum]